jgi:hypothetical protein
MRSETSTTIDKVTVAKRQLDTAIRMYFAAEDALAIHTLASAALRVLRDLLGRNKQDLTTETIRGGMIEIARAYLQGALPEDETESLGRSGFMRVIERLSEAIREGDLDRIQINVKTGREVDRLFWPSGSANFLKHADRDAEAVIDEGEVKNDILRLIEVSVEIP